MWRDLGEKNNPQKHKNTFLPSFSYLGVHDDLHIHHTLLLQPLDGSQRNPQVVGVEDLELGDRLELVHVGLWNLGDLQQAQLPIILDQRAALEVR